MSNPSRALFPGTFDPLTRGHVDIVQRVVKIFDQVIVAVAERSTKSALFSVEERVTSIGQEFADLGERVKAISFDGLLVNCARQHGARVIVRGLRAITDYDYEAQMALMNKNLDEEVETLFLISREAHSYVSSTIVKQVAQLGGDVSKLVTPGIEAAIRNKFPKA